MPKRMGFVAFSDRKIAQHRIQYGRAQEFTNGQIRATELVWESQLLRHATHQ